MDKKKSTPKSSVKKDKATPKSAKKSTGKASERRGAVFLSFYQPH